MNERYAIGVDIGGTRTKAGLVELGAGTALEEVLSPTISDDADDLLGSLSASCARLLEKLPRAARLSGLGALREVGITSSVLVGSLHLAFGPQEGPDALFDQLHAKPGSCGYGEVTVLEVELGCVVH